jgi:hypothetical protein
LFPQKSSTVFVYKFPRGDACLLEKVSSEAIDGPRFLLG